MNVVVCGVPRSGTSWVAEVLSEAEGARLVNEPDHPLTNPAGGIAVSRLGLYPVLAAGEPAEPYELIWDVAFAGGFPVNPATSRASRVLARLPASARHRLMSITSRAWRRLGTHPEHVVAKTVAGQFALEWISDRYRAQVVITRRNLLNVIGSWKRLEFVPYGGVENPVRLPEHPFVRREYVEALGLSPIGPDGPMLEQITFHVGLLAAHLDRISEAHPEWLVISHEEFSSEPEPRFRSLCSRLGFEWSPKLSERLSASDAPGSGTATQRSAGQLREGWRRDLNGEELARVLAVLRQFGDGYPSMVEARRAGGESAPA